MQPAKLRASGDWLKWKNVIVSNGLTLDERQLRELVQYHDLLKGWNSRVNLISRNDESNIWPNHIVHSLSLLFRLTIPERSRMADIGSGGGLPGIPLAIALPNTTVVMIESIRKKCSALLDIVSRLGLQNASVKNARAEELVTSSEFKASFDFVTARAVAPISKLVYWSLPLVRKRREHTVILKSDGKRGEISIPTPVLIAFKGGSTEDEVSKARSIDKNLNVYSYDLMFKGIEATSLVEKKIVIIPL